MRALGLKLDEERTQVSMNLVDYRRTDVATAHSWVERLAREAGVELLRSELIGCAPRGAWRIRAASSARSGL